MGLFFSQIPFLELFTHVYTYTHYVLFVYLLYLMCKCDSTKPVETWWTHSPMTSCVCELSVSITRRTPACIWIQTSCSPAHTCRPQPHSLTTMPGSTWPSLETPQQATRSTSPLTWFGFPPIRLSPIRQVIKRYLLGGWFWSLPAACR